MFHAVTYESMLSNKESVYTEILHSQYMNINNNFSFKLEIEKQIMKTLLTIKNRIGYANDKYTNLYLRIHSEFLRQKCYTN